MPLVQITREAYELLQKYAKSTGKPINECTTEAVVEWYDTFGISAVTYGRKVTKTHKPKKKKKTTLEGMMQIVSYPPLHEPVITV